MGKKPRRSWFIRDSVGNWMFARKEWGTPASEEPLRAAGKKFFFLFLFFFFTSFASHRPSASIYGAGGTTFPHADAAPPLICRILDNQIFRRVFIFFKKFFKKISGLNGLLTSWFYKQIDDFYVNLTPRLSGNLNSLLVGRRQFVFILGLNGLLMNLIAFNHFSEICVTNDV